MNKGHIEIERLAARVFALPANCNISIKNNGLILVCISFYVYTYFKTRELAGNKLYSVEGRECCSEDNRVIVYKSVNSF